LLERIIHSLSIDIMHGEIIPATPLLSTHIFLQCRLAVAEGTFLFLIVVSGRTTWPIELGTPIQLALPMADASPPFPQSARAFHDDCRLCISPQRCNGRRTIRGGRA